MDDQQSPAYADEPVETVSLSSLELGPLWDRGVFISNDFDELHEWLGISRELYELIMDWHEKYRDGPHVDSERRVESREQARSYVLANLRREVHPGIVVIPGEF